MTRAGFPHSDILGSRFVCQLPEAYRRLQRPSSAPGAKASTLCPYKLDHKDHSKRCSRPLCSSQATTGSHPPRRLPSTPQGARRFIRTRRARRPEHQNTTPQGDTRRSAPRQQPQRLFPQDPTACQADPPTSRHPFPPAPKRDVLGAADRQAGRSRCSTLEHHPQLVRPGRGPGQLAPPMTGTAAARCSLERR